MKNLKSIILGLALLITCGTVNAGTKTEGENLTKNYAINTYVDAMTRGKLSGLDEVLDRSVKFSMLRGKNMLSFNKKEMLNYLKKTGNVEQACTTSTRIVESNADLALIRVDMKFENFVRSNYLTVANTGNGWKITNVYSVFK
ncbi:nuclear transport factor 2 family protein [Mucilaginibacter segetis]|uniref:Nuclear transport factor 2 family protein n=1 Tax=Mucilaginibacter segetis TaxID=2793071 RepID=A0A934UP06_9SPHI|nr:nuclear transport factor 2 family protein [Mucilaginibacter segetis]MBK0380436.1 nuclear transport factor 2 family protein [Mucilaginibacter segetis]